MILGDRVECIEGHKTDGQASQGRGGEGQHLFLFISDGRTFGVGIVLPPD